MSASLTIVVSSTVRRDGVREVTLSTWGVRAGRYGSLGRVSFDAQYFGDPASVEDLASMVLTALYGLPYDL